jgi:hypothetical protein
VVGDFFLTDFTKSLEIEASARRGVFAYFAGDFDTETSDAI